MIKTINRHKKNININFFGVTEGGHCYATIWV